jgi:ubiquinone/menaquinone biosynthesis C-methylase UbiE
MLGDRNLKKKLGDVYSYPDVEDKITSFLIMERATTPQLWEKSERTIINRIEKYVKQFPGKWLLDAGCGTGRLLPHFQEYFDKILAIDPDPVQIQKAKDLAKSRGFADKVIFETTSVQELSWQKTSIDTIVCSHMLQHIRTKSVPQVLQKFYELSKMNGHLFIMTTHSKNQDYFVKEYLKGHKLIEEKISAEEFNSVVTNKQNILPIHLFSKRSIQNIMRASGYTVLDYRLFHRVSRTDNEAKESRDMLIIGQKI